MKLARLSCITLSVAAALAGPKLTFEERTEIVRGLMAEFATVKVALPRSKKPLEVTAAGKYQKEQWAEAMQQNGPAGRVGDLVQITRVIIESDRIVLEINDGMKGRHSWLRNVQVGTGRGTSPVLRDQSTSAPGGTTIALVFEGPVPPKKAAELKKMLLPVLDFEKHSATGNIYLPSSEVGKESMAAIKKAGARAVRWTESAQSWEILKWLATPEGTAYNREMAKALKIQ